MQYIVLVVLLMLSKFRSRIYKCKESEIRVIIKNEKEECYDPAESNE